MKFSSDIKTKIFSTGKGLILVYIFLAILMISSALLELHQSKTELLRLMESQSHSLLESLLIASSNILRSDNYLNEAFEKRALDQAFLIKSLYENRQLNNKDLNRIARQDNIHMIRVYSPTGKIIISNEITVEHSERFLNTRELLSPLFSEDQDTLILGLHTFDGGREFHYTLALMANNGYAIVLDLNANYLVGLRRHSGFGLLIRNIVSGNQDIIYAALQDTSSIMAASGNVSQLVAINESDFLRRAYQDSLFLTNITDFDTISVFEAVHPFVYEGRNLGLFRLGLSLEPLDDINDRIIRRLAIITIILLVIGSIFFTYVFIRQRYQLLQKEYSVVETYSGSIIENVSDSIIVAGEINGIKIINDAAEKLFETKRQVIYGNPLSTLITNEINQRIQNSKEVIAQTEVELNGRTRHILISHNKFTDAENETNTIFLIRDMTEIRALESQVQRKARLSAMGELAAGVAHEIRNPLNTIGTIAQQLHRDFTPKEEPEEYKELNKLVIGEVERINKTIHEFLVFTKPEPVKPESFHLEDWLKSIELQFKNMLAEKKINLNIENQYMNKVSWDKNQMRQVLLNLIQNSIDALESGGNINISVNQVGDHLHFVIHDDGIGIPDEVLDRVFNIYFSTKPGGTGIGLSIVQRIIQDHNGSIELESKTGTGTKFIIVVPVDLTPGMII